MLFLWYVGPEPASIACFGIEVTGGATLDGIPPQFPWLDDCYSLPCLTGPVVVAVLDLTASGGPTGVCLAPHHVTHAICSAAASGSVRKQEGPAACAAGPRAFRRVPEATSGA